LVAVDETPVLVAECEQQALFPSNRPGRAQASVIGRLLRLLREGDGTDHAEDENDEGDRFYGGMVLSGAKSGSFPTGMPRQGIGVANRWQVRAGQRAYLGCSGTFLKPASRCV
jgi:hypothetical protein